MRAVFGLLFFGGLAAGQTSQADPPLIRVTTRLVEVSVIARDGKGPVADLTADDFAVFENGVERTIAFFSRNSVRPADKGLAAPAPNVFTNRPDVRQDSPVRLTVLVLDGLNTDFGSQARARQQFLKFVRDIGPRDRVAVWAMSDTLRRLQDFTSDARQLTAVVERYRPAIFLTPELQGPPALDADAEARTAEMAAYYRMHLTNDLIKELAAALARIPGRKNVIWLSAAFSMEVKIGPGGPETSYVEDQMGGTGRALAKGNVALYPVDVRGLVAPGAGQSASTIAGDERKRHRTMELLAEMTGGHAFHNANDIANEIRQAVSDSEVTYTLGFYPDPGSQDGNFHPIQIDAKRKGVDLRYRKGYFAADAQIPVAEVDGREEIHNALESPLDAAGISVTVRVEKPDAKRPGWMRLTVAIPAKDIALLEVEKGWLGTLDLVIAQHSADGRDLATVGDPVRVNADKLRYEALLKQGLLLRRQIQLRDGVSKIRVVVFDRGSGRLGSVEFQAPR